MWLIFEMAKPISLDSANDDVSEISSHNEDKREQDLTMLGYMRNLNQQVKLKRRDKPKNKSDQASTITDGDSELFFNGKSKSSDYDDEPEISEINDDMNNLRDQWGGGDEMGLRTAVFLSFLKHDMFKSLRVSKQPSQKSTIS